MEILPIREKDYKALKTLFLKERRATFSWLNSSEFRLNDFEKATQGELILVALENDIPIGFISIWMPNNFIHHLYIDKHFQNKGVGTQLLKAAIQKTRLPISLKCLEKNTKAVDYYKRKGFVEKEKGLSEHGDYILFELSEMII